MRVLVVENYPNTPLGLVGEALGAAGVLVDIARMHCGDELPTRHDGYDGLIMLGGAQSALDDGDHPYLPDEARLAKDFGDADKPVLGICLGAQLVARAYGARNILGRPIEFGWHEVRSTPAGRDDPVLSAIGAAAPLFHWHLDTFTLPPGAVHLAESEATTNQAFRIGRATYGIQFHFEAGTELVAQWTRDLESEISRRSPDWPSRHPGEAARHGNAADAAGRALARAWVDLLREPESSARPVPARTSQSAGGGGK